MAELPAHDAEATVPPAPMNTYNFILEASSFEKGLGNIKRWCQDCPDSIRLRLYMPTFTLNELDFLRYKRKSFVARESLKFIDSIDHKTENPEIIIEFPEILDIISWSEVLDFVGENPSDVDTLNRLPRRLKNLIKSCLYKCQFDDGTDGLKWILITEDPQVRSLANICRIPWCSLVDADSALTKEMNAKQYKESERFNKLMVKNGIKEETSQYGQRVVKTTFESTVYAPRGRGELWSP